MLPAALVCLVYLAGCTGPAGRGDDIAVYDFSRDFGMAEVAREQSRLRVADPDFERRLGDGWGPLETDAEGDSFRWTLGRRAEIDVFVTAPRDVHLICRCSSLTWPSAPRQRMVVQVGDWSSEAVTVGDGSEAEVFLPAEGWRSGWNRVTLLAARATPPSEVVAGDADSRPLGLRVEALEFRGLLDAEAPTVADGLLRLPVGSSVTSFGESAGQTWTLGDIETVGAAGLGVYLRTAQRRAALEPGPIDVPFGEPIAVELIAEPVDPPWWRRMLRRGPNGRNRAEVTVRDAQVLLPADKMPRVDQPDPETIGSTRGSAAGVIVYMIDTLRADRLGSYGSNRGLTPNLDALAAESVVFTEARAQSSWTRPSVVSMFTGLYPQHHGVDDRNDGLVASVDTLAEVLFEAGADTAGLVTNGNLSHQFGLGRGFAHYRHLPETSDRESYHVLADELNAFGLHWLDLHQETRPDQPFFLYLHATDPHAPYTAHGPFTSRFAPGVDPSLGDLAFVDTLRDGESAGPEIRDQLLALYDAEVAWTDAQLGSFFASLRERDLWGDTMVIVVSDHGEEFLDHGGWEHGHTLYDEQLLVPLLIKPPAEIGAPRRVAGPAGHVDLMPTILDALGVDYDVQSLEGRSLWPAVVGASERSTGAPELSHLELGSLSLRSLVVGPWKLIEDLNLSRRRLVDVPNDPAEQKDLQDERPLRAGVLSQERRRLEQGLESESADEVELDDETRKQLEALGYAG